MAWDSWVLTRREGTLVEAGIQAAGVCRNSRAAEHLRLGFVRRVVMLCDNRHHVNQVVAEAGEQNLGVYTCTTMNIHLNSFYVHVRGALDNLAWAIQHEFQLLPEIVGEQGSKRVECNIFGRASAKRSGVDGVERDRSWTFLRHGKRTFEAVEIQLPTGFPSTHHQVNMSSEEEVAEYRRLEGLANETFRAGRHHQGSSYLSMAVAVGKYAPIVWEFDDSGQQVRGLREILAEDFWNFALTSEAMLGDIFAVAPWAQGK